jgi:hypothetical protein
LQLGGVRTRRRLARRAHEVAGVEGAGAEDRGAERGVHLEELAEAELGRPRPRDPPVVEPEARVGRHARGRRTSELVLEQPLEVGRLPRFARGAQVERVEAREAERRQPYVLQRLQDLARRVQELGAAADALRLAHHLREPGVELRLGRPAGGAQTGRRGRRRAAEDDREPVGQLDPRPRRLGELQLRRRDLAVGDGVHRRRGAGGVAADELVDALGRERVAERVQRPVERRELGVERRAVVADGHAEPVERDAAAVDESHERHPVHHLGGRDRLDLGDGRRRRQLLALAHCAQGQSQRPLRRPDAPDALDRGTPGLLRLAQRLLGGVDARQHGDAAETGDEAVELPVVEPALEAVAEESAQLLSLADPVDERLGDAHALGREVDRERARVGVACVREIAAPEHGRGRGLRHGRGVEKSAGLTGGEERPLAFARRRTRDRRPRRRLQVLHPAEAPEDETPRSCLPELVEPPGGERRDPGVEPVGPQVEAAGKLPGERVDRQLLEVGEAGAELLEGRRLGLLRRRQRVERRAERGVGRRRPQQGRRRGRLPPADDVDEDGLAKTQVGQGAAAHQDPPRRRRVGEQDRVAEQQVEERVGLLRREASGQALGQDVVEGRGAQERDVVRAQNRPGCGDLLARGDERAAQVDRALGGDDLEEALVPREPLGDGRPQPPPQELRMAL